ncbi:hypothetical protein ACFLVC_00020 [Chloroflexota bacterium]
MKIVKSVLALVLIAGLLVGTLGCEKATGGGKVDDAFVQWNEAVAGEEWDWGQTGNHKVTFGFNVQGVGERNIIEVDPYYGTYFTQNAKGQLQLIDHDLKWKLHGEFTNLEGGEPGPGPIMDPDQSANFEGTCTGDGGPGIFRATFYDRGEPGASNGDRLAISARSNDNEYVFVPGYGWYWMPKWEYYVDAVIDGGNIQIHAK